MSVFDILNKLRTTASTKEKVLILTENKDNPELTEILKATYDKVTYTYGVTSRTVEACETDEKTGFSMKEVLTKLNDREVTGHKALCLCKAFLNSNDSETNDLFLKVIDRDLKIGVNVKTVNKVFKNLVPKPFYCRCDVLSEKTLKKFKFPALIQLKCDGSYREVCVNNGNVSILTRSGEPDTNPVIEKEIAGMPDGYYLGEFTLGKADETADRFTGNGNLNSDTPDYDNIHFTVWDHLTESEYALKDKTPYGERFKRLNFSTEHIHVVPSKTVKNIEEALSVTSEYMNNGLEGGVLKSFDMQFKNGTSKEQLKIKLKVDLDLRCTGFLKGTKGTKYESQNKVILFENDEGTIRGQCSGMTDEMVSEVTQNPEKYIGKIVAVQFNDLSKSEDNDYYALTHPRFIQFRDDKNESDTLERAFELRNMARSLK